MCTVVISRLGRYGCRKAPKHGVRMMASQPNLFQPGTEIQSQHLTTRLKRDPKVTVFLSLRPRLVQDKFCLFHAWVSTPLFFRMNLRRCFEFSCLIDAVDYLKNEFLCVLVLPWSRPTLQSLAAPTLGTDRKGHPLSI